jgi:multicomponent Na+:H+ antiporter subunit E
MSLFMLNVLLAFAWAIVNGSLAARDVAIGFVVGYLILWLVGPALGGSPYHRRALKLIPFGIWYLCQLVRSNVRVAMDILSPRLTQTPAIVAVPLDCESDAEITAVANLCSLTPGTVCLSLSPDRQVMYVHVMNLEPGQVEIFRRELKEGIERRVLVLSRGSEAVNQLRESKS